MKAVGEYKADVKYQGQSQGLVLIIGSVISYAYPDNSESPIAFASRTLSRAESSYEASHRVNYRQL